MKSIKLMAEYGQTVLWGEGGAVIDPADLPVSAELAAAIRTWAEAYDRTLNHDYPPDSGFPTPAEAEAFEAEGQRLWGELRRELGPDYAVSYFSDRDRKLYE